ncbi:TPA: hypothetical protein ACGOR8_001977 [Streptococcus suis]
MKRVANIEDRRQGWLADIRVGWLVVVRRKGFLSKDLGFSAKVERITASGQIIVGNPGKPSIKFMPDGYNENYYLGPYSKEWQQSRSRHNQLYHIKRWLKDEDFVSELTNETIKQVYDLLNEKEKK